MLEQRSDGTEEFWEGSSSSGHRVDKKRREWILGLLCGRGMEGIRLQSRGVADREGWIGDISKGTMMTKWE